MKKEIEITKDVYEYAYKSPTTGGITYLIVDTKNGVLSTDYYLNNGGWRPCNEVKQKEVRRLYDYYINILEYKEIRG